MRNRNSSAILGIGKVNLKTGKCKYFNIYETYDGTVEVWKAVGPTPEGSIKLVFTAGTSAHHEPGYTGSFHQDQTGRSMPSMTLVTSARVKDMATLIPQFGKKISGFTYK